MNELYTFISIIIVPVTATLFLYLYKSKCKRVNICCGLIDIERDVRGEEKTDIIQDNNITSVMATI
jgi:hypothetical protein